MGPYSISLQSTLKGIIVSKKKQTRTQVRNDFIGKAHCSEGRVGVL